MLFRSVLLPRSNGRRRVPLICVSLSFSSSRKGVFCLISRSCFLNIKREQGVVGRALAMARHAPMSDDLELLYPDLRGASPVTHAREAFWAAAHQHLRPRPLPLTFSSSSSIHPPQPAEPPAPAPRARRRCRAASAPRPARAAASAGPPPPGRPAIPLNPPAPEP